MCFSASASFTAAAFIGAVGVASVAQSKPHLRLLASTPLFFSLQQAAEGMVWLTLGDASSLFHQISVHLFLILALIFWPLWIAIVLYRIEKKPRRRAWLKVNIAVAALVALLAGIWFILLGATAEITNHHIFYGRQVSALPYLPTELIDGLYKGGLALYLWATVGSFFLSSLRGAWMIGALSGLSYIISSIIFTETLTSVWCFFAACLSLALYFVVKK